MSAPRRRRWIDAEIDRLDPVEDASRIYLLSANRLAVDHPIFQSVMYTHGFMRIVGQVEGAIAVDGGGKVYRSPDKRSDDTMVAFGEWIHDTPTGEAAKASLARVKKIHDAYARKFEMSNATFVHTVALFTLQLELVLNVVGAEGLSEKERLAQVMHWRGVGEQLGVTDMPDTWRGMQDALEAYETTSQFRSTPEGRRLGRTFVENFASRWFPRRLRWLARWLLLSLHEDRTLRVLGLEPPPVPAAVAIRALLRAGIFVKRRLPDRRELLTLR